MYMYCIIIIVLLFSVLTNIQYPPTCINNNNLFKYIHVLHVCVPLMRERERWCLWLLLYMYMYNVHVYTNGLSLSLCVYCIVLMAVGDNHVVIINDN